MNTRSGRCPNYATCGTSNLDDYDEFMKQTTCNFRGTIAKIQDGWVARWNRIREPLCVGLYAIDVNCDVRLVGQHQSADSSQYETDDDEEPRNAVDRTRDE